MSILVLGTSSGCGKTTITALLCRYLSSKGHKVAPFKGFNLSSTSVSTSDGGEIGIGQSFQSLAAGVEPVADMNPILSKYHDGKLDLVVKGRVLSGLSHEEKLDVVKNSFDTLSESYDAVVCEGSGSPVELNMMDSDLANTGLMRVTGVPAIIVADIERGGVFAALYGTWSLIPDDLKHHLKGFVINRFRGDASILGPAIDQISKMTGMRCLGIIRYDRLDFPMEDSLSTRCDSPADDNRCIDMLDLMIEHASADGFDFDSLEKICLQ